MSATFCGFSHFNGFAAAALRHWRRAATKIDIQPNNLTLIGFVLITILLAGFIRRDSPLLKPEIPDGWGKPVYDFRKNPVTEAGFALGRRLFYDPVLSRDSTISCSSCHLSYTAFTHTDHDLSHGIDGRIGTRNAPALMNLIWSQRFMWDGAVNHLEMQALAPITNPAEMDESLAHVVEKLRRTEVYPGLFTAAFGAKKGDEPVTGQRVLLALAQFMAMLTSANARYDSVSRGQAVFTEQERRGLALFRQHCNACHTEPLFTNQGFARNGLPPDTTLNDAGRMQVTGLPEDSLKFRVPTLRNLEYSYPYMHDGRFRRLSQVLNHYVAGVQPIADPRLRGGIPLTQEDKADLMAFLLTLTDRSFVFNPVFGYPR